MPRWGRAFWRWGVGDVVHHHSYRAAVGAALGAGEDVGVVLGHDAEGRVKLFALGRRGVTAMSLAASDEAAVSPFWSGP